MGRRAKGEGSIFRRKNGRWCAQLYIPSQDGKRRVWRVYGDTRREVAVQLAQAIEDRRRGHLILERQTVAEYLRKWLQTVIWPNKRQRTAQGYQHCVDRYIIPLVGPIRLTELTAPEVQAAINQLSERYAPRTVQYAHATLRAALNHGVRWGLVHRNVAELVTPPHVPKYPAIALSPEQGQRFLCAGQGHRLAALFTVALALGLRTSEMLGIRWEDVDLDNAILYSRYTLQRQNREWVLAEHKSPRSRRAIPLPSFVVAALGEHWERQQTERQNAGVRWDGRFGLVFTTKFGAPLDRTVVAHMFQRLREAAGLPEMRPYDLRHSFASLLLARGVPIREVSELLGHAQVTLTLNTYAHILPGRLRTAAATIEAVYGMSRLRNDCETEHANEAPGVSPCGSRGKSAEGRDRTADTMIFSREICLAEPSDPENPASDHEST